MLLLLVSTGCQSEQEGSAVWTDDMEALARSVCEAALNNDEEAFIPLHLMKGDTTPDGKTLLLTEQHNTQPGKAWVKNVKMGLQRTRAHLEVLEEKTGNFSCGGLLAIDGYHESEDG